MKKMLLLFAIMFSWINLQAQTITPPVPSPTTTAPPGSAVSRGAKTASLDMSGGSTKVEGEYPPTSVLGNKSPFNLSTEKKNPVVIPRFETAPVIDGKLDERIWQQSAVFKDFYQTSPGDNVAPSKSTIAYMGYDERYLYIAFYCYDEPDKIRATLAKRDAVLGEDNVQIYLDTYDDQRRAYVLAFNPLGIQQDGIYTEGEGSDFSVDIVMESKGMIVADGWTVEIKIPFKSLRYTAGKGKMWGLNLGRNIDRFNDELMEWMPRNRNVSGFMIQAGKITGLENIQTERTLEIVPSVTLSESGNRKRTIFQSTVNRFPPGLLIDPGHFVNGGIKLDLGVNFKFNITPNITLDAALNPDFAEIEADAPVVAANQRFPIFFQEKRPFFLESSEIFQSPLQIFHSRTIVDPDIATKLTGKIGKNSFGFLIASDKAPGNYSEEERNDPVTKPAIVEFLDKNAYFGVLRLKRDFGSENNVGFFGTARSFPKNRNFAGGFDGTYKFNDATVSQFQFIGTHSLRNFYNPETDSSSYRTGKGIGYYVNLDHSEKNRGWYLEAFGRSKDYRAEAGFTRRTNTNSFQALNRISSEPKPDANIIRLVWRQYVRFWYDWQGRSQEGFVGTSLNITLQHNTSIATDIGVNYERLFEEEFGAKRTTARPLQGAFFGSPERSAYQPYGNISFNTRLNKKISFYGGIGTSWNAYDLDFGAGGHFPRVSPAYLAYLESPAYREYLRRQVMNPKDPNNFPPPAPPLDPGTGQRLNANSGFEYKPIDALQISLDYSKSRQSRYDSDRTAFDSNILTVRSAYQFTRFIFVRARVDYNSLSSNVRGQLLLGLNPSPGTAFYVGYNDDLNHNGFSPYTGQLEPNFERNSRTFFIRVSYLFRKSF